ncbi:uncharacterized protein O3C94_011651 [Discoglossus pictus]
MASSGLEEEEELWLYGGESIELHDISADSKTENQEQKNVILQVTQSCSDDEDSDSDSDDVRVTIGDIRTGAPSCMGASAHLNGKSGRGYGATARGIDFAAPGCINGLPVLEVDLDSFEEKPWRKPGADLSDYFNYGFNEATWKVYCEKQRRLQLGLDTGCQTLNKESKITVQHSRMGIPEKGRENGYVNADVNHDLVTYVEGRNKTQNSPNRKHGGPVDATVGLISSISTVEGRRWDPQVPEENIIQVIGDQGYKPHSLIQQQHHQHPPPLLPPPNIAPSNPPLFTSPPPPHFFHRPPPTTMAPPPLHPPALIPPPLIPPPSAHIPPFNGTPVSYNNRPPPHHGYNSAGNGTSSWNTDDVALSTNKRKYLQSGTKDSSFRNYPPVSTSHISWVTTTDKGTSSREQNHWTPRRERVQERERTRSETPTDYNEDDHYLNYSRERNYTYERRYRRSLEHSWEREERPRGEQRQRERGEASKPKSRRKQESEERESHRRHKRKKSKRGKEEKSVCEDSVTGGNRRELRE